jgi:ketosteroid isomerase-like protein
MCMNAFIVFAQTITQADEKTIVYLNDFRSEYIKSKANKKSEWLLSYFADDLRLMPEFQKTIIGKNNALFYDSAFANRFEVKDYQRTQSEIIDLGTRVIEIGSFIEKLILKGTKQQESITGKYMDVWSRDSGKLLLITQAWNYNHSLPWEGQLKFDNISSVDVALQGHVPINNNVSFELAAFNRLMEDIVSEHDDKLWLQFYSDDGIFMYSRNPPTAGKKALKEFLEKHVKDLVIFEKLDIRNDRIDDLGNYVIEYASHIAIIRDGDFSGVFTGKDLAIWRREPNGSLKIFRHIAMYD